MKNKKLLKYLIIVLILSIPSVFALLKPGFFVTDDGNWMIIRFSAFYEALRNGQFPVRFLARLNNGFGYPVANFLYPLFMYIGTPIHILGFSFVSTIKIIFGISLLSSAVFSLLWLRKKFDNLSSLIGSLVYLYFPYHLWDVYKRGSVGEVLALAIVPFILWQIERQSLFFISIGIALLILSHNSLALLFLPIILIYYYLSKKDIKKILFSLVFGLGMSSFFWLPALIEKRFVIFDKVLVSDFSEYFVNLQNINLIGLVFLLSFLLTFLIFRRIKDKNYWLFFIVSVVCLFLIFPISSFLWPLFSSFIQFPFRLISVLILTTAFFVAFQLNFLKGRNKKILIIIYLFLLIFDAKDFIYPKGFTNYPDTFYSTNQDTTTVKNEYMPKWVKEIPSSSKNEKVEILKGEGSVFNLINNGNSVSFNADLQKDSLLSINTIYYPGWVLEVDNKNVLISYKNDSGLIQFNLNKGNHFVKAYFKETNLRLTVNIISFVSFLGLIFLAFKLRYKKSHS